jgi:hypothetical protein
MCIEKLGRPYRIVLERRVASADTIIETYAYALGKVTTKSRSGEHLSTHGFTYPIAQTVYDQNAIVGNHFHSLHFLPNLTGARSLNEYGSHRLVVLPSPLLWESPFEFGETRPRCWHSAGCTPLFCIDCLGLKMQDLKNDECWRDLTKPRRHASDDLVLPVSRYAFWHSQSVVRAPSLAGA